MSPVPVKSKIVSQGRRKQQQQKIPEPVIVSEEEEEKEEEEESVEDESITRCVCNESHSIGLMVCCDECEVWQHCECMGLEEQEIPDQYFCELCKPSDHIEIKGYDKTRRYYKPCLSSSPIASEFPSVAAAVEKRPPKRRTTFNSREASISLEEVLAFRNAIEKSKTFDASSSTAGEMTFDVQYNNTDAVLKDYDENETSVTTSRQVRPKRQNMTESKDKPISSPRNKTEKRTSRQTSGYTRQPQSTTSSPVITDSPTAATASAAAAVVQQQPPTPTTRKTNTVNKLSRSRTSTPQPQAAAAAAAAAAEIIKTPPATTISHALFQHFTQSARESSLPARIRLPSHRMSIPDMNKRANQILEYICSMQVELATNKRRKFEAEEDEEEEEQEMKKRQLIDAQISEAMTKVAMQLDKEENEKENRRPTPILIPGKKFDSLDSCSSSLSSASTIPLEEEDRLLNDDTEKSVAEEALERINKPKSSMEMMDILTRQVITFQRRFGGSFNSHSNDEEEDGPRVTRSHYQYNDNTRW